MENTARTLPDFAGITLEKILESANLNAALKKVESNKGAPGVDGMKTDELRQYIIDHPGELRRVLLDGTYRPKPVKRVTIPKSEPGKFRELAWIFHWEPERGTLPPLFEFPMTTFSEKDRFSA